MPQPIAEREEERKRGREEERKRGREEERKRGREEEIDRQITKGYFDFQK